MIKKWNVVTFFFQIDFASYIQAIPINSKRSMVEYTLTLRPLRTSILVPPAAYVSCWGVAGAATHLSALHKAVCFAVLHHGKVVPLLSPLDMIKI